MLRTAVSRFDARAGQGCARLIVNSRANNFAALDKILKPPVSLAKLAREGKKVMQFLQHGRYIAVAVDGKVKFYGK